MPSPSAFSNSAKMLHVSVSCRLPEAVWQTTSKSTMVYRRLGAAYFGVWGVTFVIEMMLPESPCADRAAVALLFSRVKRPDFCASVAVVCTDGCGAHRGGAAHQVKGVFLHGEIAVAGAAPSVQCAFRLSAVGGGVVAGGQLAVIGQHDALGGRDCGGTGGGAVRIAIVDLIVGSIHHVIQAGGTPGCILLSV